MNHYANKKSAAESMLDVALLMANASQLKAVLEQGPDFSFYTPLIVLISVSLFLQIMVGVLLIFIGTFGFSLYPFLFLKWWKTPLVMKQQRGFLRVFAGIFEGSLTILQTF